MVLKKLYDERNQSLIDNTRKHKEWVDLDVEICTVKREMEDIKKENIELKKESGLVDTLQQQSSLTHHRNSELVF